MSIESSNTVSSVVSKMLKYLAINYTWSNINNTVKNIQIANIV